MFLFGEHNVGTATDPESVIRYGDPWAVYFGHFPGFRGGSPLFGSSSHARVVLWANTRNYEPRPVGPLGSSTPSDRFGCVGTDSCPDVNTDLSSSYWSGTLTSRSVGHQAAKGIGRFDESVVWPRGFCPVCESAFPLPGLGLGCEELPDPTLCLRWGPSLGQDDVVDLELSNLFVSKLPNGLINKLSNPKLNWLSALEPPESLSGDAISMIASRGRKLKAALRMENGKLKFRTDLSYMPKETQLGAQVLLGNRRAVLTLDSRGGRRVQWTFIDNPTAPYDQYIDGEMPWDIQAVAATIHGQLLILDRNKQDQRRLFLMDLDRGESIVLASFFGVRTNYALSSAPDGTLGLLSWFEQTPGWQLTTFAVCGSLGAGQYWYEELGGQSGEHRPLGSLRGSEFGFSFVVSDDALGWFPLGVSNADLRAGGKLGLAASL